MKAMNRWLFMALAAVAIASAPARAQEERETPRGPGDGIKVHGHWTIDIKNPDGSVASHNEFENALVGTGAATLARMLTHSTTQLLGWGIVMFPPQPAPITWAIIESAVTNFVPSQASISPNLTVVVGPSFFDVVLQGSVQAPSASTIAMVSTLMVTQEPFNQQVHYFTERILAQPITVQAGQVIQVTVDFSFS